MQLVSAIVIYIIIWWVVFFMLLPFWFQKQRDIQIGNSHSAPEKSYIGRQLLMTTLLSFVIFVAIYTVGYYGIIDYRSWVTQ